MSVFKNAKRANAIALFSFCCTLLLLPVPSTIASTQAKLPQVTLQSVLEDVTKTNPSILEAIEYYQSVAAERSIATSEYYPVIGTRITAGPERTVEEGLSTDPERAEQGVKEDITTDLTSTTAELFARQNLYNGGKTTAFVDETDARIRAAAFEVLNVANNVYLETAEAYINVVKAEELLRIAEENAFTQEKIMRQVREKTEAGFNRVSELYNSESRLALSKGSYISRQQDLNQAVVNFHRQFGRLLLPEQFVKPQPSYQVPDELAQTVDVAFKTHPALKVAKYNIQTRRFTLEKSKAAYLPSLDLELKGEYTNDVDGSEGDGTQTGAYLTFSYTFFDGGLRSGQKARDQKSLRKERQRSYVERRNVNESVRLAWNIMVAEESKASYLDQHVQLSAKTLEAFKEEYYVGRRTLLDLLNMENEFTDAKLSQSDSKYSYLVAIYRIMQSTGVLLDEHDTGLREMLSLPVEDSEDLADYVDELQINRDNDETIDDSDQCDNSNPDSPTQAFGCVDDDIATTGYPKEEDLQLTPYITPQDFNVPVKKEDNPPPEDAPENESPANILDTRLRLDVKPNVDFVTDQSMTQLAQLTEALIAQPEASIVIEGFIASNNDTPENTALSQRRANVVKDYMIEQGVNASRITAIGRGNENPIASNDTSAGRKMNRRIEITVNPAE